MAWFWDAVARGGEGISAEELAAHVISGGWSPHVGLDSPALFAFSLRNGVFGGAALKEVARGADGLVRTSFQTPSGLRLEAHFVLDPDREHRIIPTPAERFMRYTVRGNTTFRKSPSEGKQSAGVGITTVGLRLEGGASMTAITAAALRAAHYVADEPKILADSLAQSLSREFAVGQIAQVQANRMALPGRIR